MKITLAHGSGGEAMDKLIKELFISRFSNPALDALEDAAVLPTFGDRLAFTTDSFVVTPLVFSGGDIGKLAVCGTVNDLAMRGAVPKYLSCGFVLEEGLEISVLENIVSAMRVAADEAGVIIAAGDTKVTEGKGGVIINTSGIGFFEKLCDIGIRNAKAGDALILSGLLGEHHACILSARMGIESGIKSDCAPLNHMVKALLDAGLAIHALRDITRGGLGTVLNEMAQASNVEIALDGKTALCSDTVRGFCDILGLDILNMANEGKFALVLPMAQAAEALGILHTMSYGQEARLVGEVLAGEPSVTILTRAGSKRRVKPLIGEGLPRIC